jgi:hypothetical protein
MGGTPSADGARKGTNCSGGTDLLGRRDRDPFAHVADDLVGKDEDRGSVTLRVVERLDGEVEHLLG